MGKIDRMGRYDSRTRKTGGKKNNSAENTFSAEFDPTPPPHKRRINAYTVRVQGEIRERSEQFYCVYPHHVLEWDFVDDAYWKPHRVAPRSLNYGEMRKTMPELIKDRIALIVKCHYQHDKVNQFQVLYPIAAKRLHLQDSIIIHPKGGLPALGTVLKITDVIEASAGHLAADFVGWVEFTPVVQAQIEQRRLQARKDEVIASLKKRQENIDLAEQFKALAKADPDAAAELEELESIMAAISQTNSVLDVKAVEHTSTDDVQSPKAASKRAARR